MKKNTQYEKRCPICSKKQTYSRIDTFNLAVKNNSICLSCSLKGRFLSEKTKRKLHIANVGIHRSQEIKDKISVSMKGKRGKPHTDETKHKLRSATIFYLKKRGIIPSSRNYNPKACEFIDELNKENGWNLQHALNGGEVELYGYFVDGYDKERNIIFEYDEKHHMRRDRKNKDLEKQKNLLREINPFLFLRYNETSKELHKITNEN